MRPSPRHPRGTAFLASVPIAGAVGATLMLTMQRASVTGMLAQRHVTLKDDVEAIRRHLLQSLDCNATLASGNLIGTTKNQPIPDPIAGGHCDPTASDRKLLLLKDRNGNALTAPLETASGPLQNTGRLGEWVLLVECDRVTNHSLTIRAARGRGNEFFEDPLTRRKYDFGTSPLFLFGGPVQSPGGQRFCQDRLGGGLAPGTQGALPRWETPTTFVPSVLFQDPKTDFVGFNTNTPKVRFHFNLDNQLLKFRNDRSGGAAEISLEGGRTGSGTNTASLEFINWATGAWWHQSLRGDTGNLEFHFRPSGTSGIESRNGPSPTVQIRFFASTGQIQANGVVLTSDRRLKRDIDPLSTDVVDKVHPLRGVSFRWANNPQSGKVMGLIAQEVAEIYPDLVSRDGAGFYRVNYDGLFPILVETVKRQNRELEQLKAKQLELERRIDALARSRHE